MNSFLLLAVVTLPSPHQETVPKPVELIGTMLGRYASAQSMKGSVSYRQFASAAQGSAEQIVTTEFAFERPARMRIAQKSTKYQQKTFLVTSDGQEYSHDVLDLEAPPGLRLTQPVADPTGVPNLGRLLAFARKALPDPTSPFLAFAASAKWDLKLYQIQWMSLQDGGIGEVNGTPCRIVKGKWRRVADQDQTGTFGMWVTPAGDLLKYSTEESFNAVDEDHQSQGKVTLLEEWTGTIAVNPTIPADTFKVIR